MELNGIITTNTPLNAVVTGGIPGFSPIATVEQTQSGATITITDKNGTTTANILNGTATDAQVTTAVDAWLDENVAQETGYVLDSSLTMSNAAAPADKVGELKSAVEDVVIKDYQDSVIFHKYNDNYWEKANNSSISADKKYEIIITATSTFHLDVLQIGTSGTSASMVDTIASNVDFSVGANHFDYKPSQNGLGFLRVLSNADNISGVIFKSYEITDISHTLFVTPQQFGAVGDGNADDTASLQAAINTGKRVFIPHGTYKISQPLTISKAGTIIEGDTNISWEGGGVPTTISVDETISEENIIDAVFLFTGNSNNVSISNLYIQGNFKTKYGIYYKSTDEYFIYNIKIKDVRIQRCSQYGIYLNSCYLSSVENVRCSRCTNGGFYFSGKTEGEYQAGGTTLTLIQCYADICNNGITVERMNYSSLINCACDSINVCCYQLYRTNNISLINCGCEGANGLPIQLLGTNKAITIQGFNVIQLAPLSSPSIPDAIIQSDNISDCIISGIVVTGNSSAATRAYAIYNNPATTKIFILDNSILPSKCHDISNGCIKFYSRQIIYAQQNDPDFVGQLYTDGNDIYIGLMDNNTLAWKQISIS